jgi:outer membrane protein
LRPPQLGELETLGAIIMTLRFLLKQIAVAALFSLAGNLSLTPARAADPAMAEMPGWAGHWLVRGRIIGVIARDAEDLTPAANTEVDDSIVPELDFTYFFTDNIAVELIAAVTPHDVSLDGGPKLGTAWLLPPILLLQYHFQLADGIKPYLGAGINYTVFFSQKNKGPATSFNLKDEFGWALQAGVDIHLNENWYINLDVKKVFLDPKIFVVAGAAITGRAKLDPWIIGLGIGYRF